MAEAWTQSFSQKKYLKNFKVDVCGGVLILQEFQTIKWKLIRTVTF